MNPQLYRSMILNQEYDFGFLEQDDEIMRKEHSPLNKRLGDIQEIFNFESSMDENANFKQIGEYRILKKTNHQPRVIKKSQSNTQLSANLLHSKPKTQNNLSMKSQQILSNIKQQQSQQQQHNNVRNSYKPPTQSKSMSLLGSEQQSTTMRELIAKKEITWKFKVDTEDPPQVEFDIYVDEFASSTLEFALWANKNPQKYTLIQQIISRVNLFTSSIVAPIPVDNENDEDSPLHHIDLNDYKIIGNVFISMNKFCSNDVSVLAEMESLLIQEARFEDKLWNHGIVVGSVRGEFVMKNNPFLRQMIGGIRTEEGIQKASQLYIKKDIYASKNNSQINTIIQTNVHLEELVCKLNLKDLPHRNRVKINDQITQIITKLKQQLQQSNAQQQLYKNEDELKRSQLVLTDLAKNLLFNADLVDEVVREQYYEILLYLLLRDEFHLSYIGFDKSYQQLMHQANKKEQQVLQQKIRIGLHYQSFLYKTLEKTLIKMGQKGYNIKENSFVLQFIVVAYFRIPELQNRMIEALKQDNRKLHEYFEEDLLSPDATLVISNDYFVFSFEWNQNFYEYLQNEPRFVQNKQYLETVLNEINWNKLISKKGYVFLKWLSYLCNHIKKSRVAKGFIQWKALPGYGLLVKQFLIELKYINEYPYPDVFKEVSQSLLENQSLLNYFIIVLFNKTKLYDGIAVFYTLDMINFWFDTLKNKKIPTDFNYMYFLKGLFLIFEGQHALSIAKALQLVYNIYPQLPIEIQKEICDHLMGKCFFKFFMFWSKTVRWVFQQFLIYRVQHRYRNLKSDTNKMQDIQREFHYLKLKKNVQTLEEKEHLINDMIYLKYTQMIEILVKMKKIMSQHCQQQERLLDMQLEARSMKLKLLRKKLIKQKINNLESSNSHGRNTDQKKSESPQNDIQIDITLQTLKLSNNSLTFDQQSEQLFHSADQRQSQKIIEGQLSDCTITFFNKYLVQLDDDNLQEINILERSYGEIINLDDIIEEIQKEKKVKRQNKKQRNNSVELNESIQKQKNEENVEQSKNKKIVIYHRLNNYDSSPKLDIPKELLKYLLTAMAEWQEQQVNYKKWFSSKRMQLSRQKISEPEQLKELLQCDPPEIFLSVPKDESESNVEQEW